MKQKERYPIDSAEEREHYNSKPIISKYDYDLFDEEKHIAQKLLRVKRTTGRGERWRILEDDDAIFTLEATRLTKREKEYLRTPDGINFLLAAYKDGVKTIVGMKTRLKNKLTTQ